MAFRKVCQFTRRTPAAALEGKPIDTNGPSESPRQEGAEGRVNFQIPAQHKLKREERVRLPGYPQCGAGGQRQPQAGVPVPEQLDSSDQLFRNR